MTLFTNNYVPKRDDENGESDWEKDMRAVWEEREARNQPASNQQPEGNQPAPQPQSEQEAILMKHMAAARDEINERAKLTAEQREVESLEKQIEEMAARMEEMYRHPSRYSKELDELEPKLQALFKRHEDLTGASVRKPKLPVFISTVNKAAPINGRNNRT